MTETNESPGPAAAAATDARTGFLLFNRRPVLCSAIIESLEEMATITGASQGEIRMRLTGQGIGVLKFRQSMEKLRQCASDMAAIGIACGTAENSAIKQTTLPPAARHIRMSSSSITFLDTRKAALLEITDATDLLVILTDLSGKAVRQIMTAMAYTGIATDREFEDVLKKISISKPAAAIYALNGADATGVYVDSDIFSYLGLNDKMAHSKGINFRIMIQEAMATARSSITDAHFGISLLPGASPDWNLGKRAVENEFGRYTGYILAAVAQKLLPFSPGPEEARDLAAKKEDTGGHSAASGMKQPGHPYDTTELKPPPDSQHSRFTAFFQTSLPEMIVGLLIVFAPFSLFVTGARHLSSHPVFWKAVTGFGVLTAGVLMFGYSLLLLYYRRMIENTPTSKIRSMSMGMVELTGKTRLYYDLRTSATKTHCIYYKCRYYKYQRTGDSAGWKLTRSVSSGKIPFYIEDDTGRVLIHPDGAIINIPLASQSFQGSYIPTLGLQMHDPNTKVVEELIPVGTHIYVLGSAQVEKHGKTFSQALAEKLRHLKQNAEAMEAYDANGDGRIDVDEWEAARKDAETVVYAESLAKGGHQTETVVVKKPKFGMLPFIIADTEQKVVRRLMFRTLVFLTGGLIIMGASVSFLVKLF